MLAIIIEDELPAARKLERLLDELSVSCVAKFQSVSEGISFLKTTPKIDVIFSDIQLTDGLSFEIFEKVKCDVPIIFTTAFDEYAIKAFKLNSVDYLLKPIIKNELEFALKKLQQTSNKQEFNLQKVVSVINESINKAYPAYFQVKIGSRTKLIPIAEIAYFMSEHKTSFLVTSSGRSFAIDESLDKLKELINPADFFRCSRQHIINKNYLSEYISYSSNRLKIILSIPHETLILVSRDRINEFKNWIAFP